MATKPKPKTIPGPVPAMEMPRAAKPEQNKAALRGEPLTATRDLDEYDRRLLAACVAALNVWRGCTTPAEELIRDLLGAYDHFGGALHPEFAKLTFDEFFDNHENAIEAARMMAQRFPKEVLVSSDNANAASGGCR